MFSYLTYVLKVNLLSSKRFYDMSVCLNHYYY